jgi:transketolase
MVLTTDATDLRQQRGQRVADYVRCRALHMIALAGTGHPGIASGCAEIGTALFDGGMRYDPGDPRWIDRDRFVLSAGHGSALLYTLLALYQHELDDTELDGFRRLSSRTPGHPEYGVTPGVEATAGPLGEGLGAAVGMALAETVLAQRFNRPGFPIIDHHTLALVGDGDLMEGVGQESIGLAGLFGLDKLTVIWDANQCTSSGPIDRTTIEDVPARFGAAGWDVLAVDGHDIDAIRTAILRAKPTPRPSLIAAHTITGRHLDVAGSHRSHAAPVSPSAVDHLASHLGLDDFADGRASDVTDYVTARQFDLAADRARWDELMRTYTRVHPKLAKELVDGSPAWHHHVSPDWLIDQVADATSTREASIGCIRALGTGQPTLVNCGIDSGRQFPPELGRYSAADRTGRNVNCGVREHGMGAVLNGLAYHGGVVAVGSCFASFLDHLRPSLRVAAISELPVIIMAYADSVLAGPDGPTHQAVEQLAALRATPGVTVWRPADAVETAWAWHAALREDRPTILIVANQMTPALIEVEPGINQREIGRGGYVAADTDGPSDLTIVATGSEVHVALEARHILASSGIAARVVSVPCVDRFLAQDDAYRQTVAGPVDRPILVVEAARALGWSDTFARHVDVMDVTAFGRSGSHRELAEHFGFTGDKIAATAGRLMEEWSQTS